MDQSCFGGILQAVEQGTFHEWKEKMDNESIKFQQILDANLMPSVKKLKLKSGWFLQMDNNPKHVSKSMVDYIKRHKLKVLPWPSQSSDLNIIENLWIDLKRALRDRQTRNIKVLQGRMGEDSSNKNWKTLGWLQKAFTSCDTCQSVLTLQGAQTFADAIISVSVILKV